MEVLEVLGYLGAVLTGVSLGLIGGGGSILIVPVLVYLFKTDATQATAYSLFLVGVSSLFGAANYAKQKLIDYKTAVVFAIPAFVGVFTARAYVVPNIPQEIAELGPILLTKDMLIMVVFAVVMLLASYSMIKKKKNVADADENAEVEPQYNFPMIGLEGLLVGGITGFVGAGGGFLIIPALVILAKIPMKTAVGTSLLIIASKSLFGFLGDLSSHTDIDWTFLLSLTGTSIAGIFVGTYLTKFIPGAKLKPAFGWFVLVIGTYILGRQFV